MVDALLTNLLDPNHARNKSIESLWESTLSKADCASEKLFLLDIDTNRVFLNTSTPILPVLTIYIPDSFFKEFSLRQLKLIGDILNLFSSFSVTLDFLLLSDQGIQKI